jgi:hypothetical protein
MPDAIPEADSSKSESSEEESRPPKEAKSEDNPTDSKLLAESQETTLIAHEISEDHTEAPKESDIDQLIITLIDLVISRDHIDLGKFLGEVLIDITKVYDERGFNMAHIAAMNNDPHGLDMMLNYIFYYWE